MNQWPRCAFERVKERLPLKTRKLVGDTAYGATEMWGRMVKDKAIEPHVPAREKA